MEIAKLYATIGADASGLNKALSSAKSDLNVAAKGFSQFESVVSTGFKAIAVAGAAVFAGVAAGMTKAINVAASLEQQAANTAAVFGSMAPPVKEVKDLISELGLNPQLLVSMDEAGSAINMLAKNGIAWEAIAGGVAEKTVLLANATGADFALAADAATDALAIFNLGVEDMDRVVSSAVAMVTNSKFDMQDFAYVLANLAPTAATMGISLEEMSAVVTMTASSFKSGRTAATSWSLLLQNLVPQSEAASDAMKELNLMTGEGQSVFFDANGNLKEMSEVLSIIKSTFGGLTQEQQINYSRTIFGREAYGALAAVLQLNTAELGAMTEKMGDMDAVIEGAKTRTATFRAAWSLLGDTLTAVLAQIGDQFLPLFGDLARELAQFVADQAPAVVEWFGKIAAELGDVIEWVRAWITTGDMFNEKWDEVSPRIQGVVLAVKGFIDIIGHTMTAIGEFVGRFVTWQDVWTAFGLLLGVTLVKAIAGFVIAISPLLLVIGSAIAIVAALRTAWENDWLGIRTTFEPIVNFILQGFRSLSEAFWLFVADGKITSEEFRRLWEIAAVYVGGALTLMWGHAKTAFANMATEVTTFATTLDQHIREMTGGLLALQDIIIGLAAVISVRLTAAFYVAAIPAIKAFLVAAAPWAGWIAAAIAAVVALRLAWENDWMGIRTAFEPVLGVIERGVGLLMTLFKDFRADGKITGEEWGKLWDAAQIVFGRAAGAIWKGAKEFFGNIWDALTEIGEKVWAEFAERFPKAADVLTRTLSALGMAWGSVWGGIRTAFEPVIGVIQRGVELLVALLKDIIADGKITGEEWKKLWEGAQIVFGRVGAAIWKAVTEVFGNIKDYIASNLPGWTANLAAWGVAAYSWITDIAIPMALQKLGEWTAALFKWLGDKLPDWLATLAQWATAAVTWIGDSIPKVIDNFSEWLDNILDWGGQGGKGFLGFLGMVAGWVKALWEWVQNDLWPKLSPELTKLGTAIVEALKKIGEALWNEAKEIAKVLVDRWGQGIAERWQAFKDYVKQRWQEIRDIPQSAWEDFKRWGRDIVEGLRQGISDAWNSFTSWVGQRWEDLKNRFKYALGISSPSTVFRDFGQNITDGLRMGIDAGASSAFGAMDSLAGGIAARAAGITASLGAQATEWNRILGNIAHGNAGTGTGGSYTPTAIDPVTQGAIDLGMDIGVDSGFDIMAGVANLAAWGKTFANDVANYAGSLAYDTAVEAGLVGTAYRGAVTTLTDSKEDTDAALIQALYTLVNALRAAPSGNQFNITTAASQTGNAYTDLSSLIAYLNAQYAS